MKNVLARLLRDEQGTEVVEWALVAGFIIIAAIAAISSLGGKVGTAWDSLDSNMTLPPAAP